MSKPEKNAFGHYEAHQDIYQILESEGVRVRHKGESLIMKSIGWLLSKIKIDFMGSFWTTISGRTIWAPDKVDLSPGSLSHPSYHRIIRHELVHIGQARRLPILWQLSYVLLLPVLLAYGRWLSERSAYMVNIMDAHEEDRAQVIEDAVSTLWRNYVLTWPKPLMRRWFTREADRRELATLNRLIRSIESIK